MSNKPLFSYIDEIEELAQIRDKALMTGDYKSGNSAYKKIDNIFNIVRSSDEKEKFYLTIIDLTKSPSVLIFVCADMLLLNIKPRLAKKMLKKMSKDKNIDGRFRLESQMFLEEWKKGNITSESQNIKV